MTSSPPTTVPDGGDALARSLVRRELLRALGGIALVPLRAAAYLAQRGRLRRAMVEDLAGAPADGSGVAHADAEALRAALGALDRPLRVFVSCAEASGESHAVELVRALRARAAAADAAEPELAGLGGALLAGEGVSLLGDPVARAAMGADAARSVSFYAGLLRDTARHWIERPPDVVVPVDSPALHVPLGHIAHGLDLGVVHYVTPQYWGWAPWRVAGYRRAVDLGLTILPFEPAWFARHGVRTAHVGHPQVELLADVPRDGAERSTLVLLPGSRGSVIRRNLPWMLAAAARLRLRFPDLEVVLPHDRSEKHDELAQPLRAAGAEGWVRLAMGDLHGELLRARAALSVSGTVLLDLLHHRIPTAVLYRTDSRLLARLGPGLLTVPWFASVNLLAGREVLPEFHFSGRGPEEEVDAYLGRCLGEPAFHAGVVRDLEEAARRLGPPGAPGRAAEEVLSFALARARGRLPLDREAPAASGGDKSRSS